MTKPIKAIFENGVFRPLERVDLKEHQEVTLSVCHHTEDNLADLATLFFGDQGIEFCFGSVEQVPVAQLGPAHLKRGGYGVFGQRVP